MTTHLVWFRQDLRLHDNLALAAACRIKTVTLFPPDRPPAAIRLHACWRCISLHHASGRRITCRRVRLNLSMLN